MHAKLGALKLPADEITPFLLRVLGVSAGGESIAHLPPEEVQQRTLDAVRTTLLASSRTRALVVAVEDLHWMDRTSERYMAALVDALPEASVLLLTTSRTGRRPPWSEKSYVTELRLQPLSRSDARRVLDAALEREGAGVPLAAETAEAILHRADGNPFFIEELATAMGPLASGSTTAVPESIEAVLLARIDRLPDEPKRVLQAASVIGRDVPVRLLEAITADVATARDHLRELQRLEYVYERLEGGQPFYRFKHALTREVAYASVLSEQRRLLHGRIVAAMEAQYGDRLVEHAESLAHHALHGQLWRKALGYLQEAGRKAFARSANHEAVASLEKALGALTHLQPHEAADSAIDLRLDLFWPLVAVAEYRRGLDYLREAAKLAEARGN
jgi:predicted ATPase